MPVFAHAVMRHLDAFHETMPELCDDLTLDTCHIDAAGKLWLSGSARHELVKQRYGQGWWNFCVLSARHLWTNCSVQVVRLGLVAGVS